MSSLLLNLRRNAPHLTPEEFLRHHPGSWVQYFDDTPTKDAVKALSVSSFDRSVAQAKQRERCAVCFSVQAFEGSRTAARLVRVQNLGIDVDLGNAADGTRLTDTAIDAAKDDYLRNYLPSFPLRPHWLVETRHGFHLVFRLRPVSDPQDVRTALALNRRLVTALGGDETAVLPTQLLRVPNTYQFKEPGCPFLCRPLLDNSPSIPPYELAAFEDALRAFEGSRRRANAPDEPRQPGGPTRSWRSWRKGLSGVPEGERNATAASLAGSLLSRLPAVLWEVGGWGGLKEWNTRNAVPLPERELRSVFNSIARRERGSRGRDCEHPQSRSPA